MQLHEHTLSARMTLSNAHRTSGYYETALQHGESAMSSYRKVFGYQHPFTLACKANVAIVGLALHSSCQALALNDYALNCFLGVPSERITRTPCAAPITRPTCSLPKARPMRQVVSASRHWSDPAVSIAKITRTRSRVLQTSHSISTRPARPSKRARYTRRPCSASAASLAAIIQRRFT